MTIQYSIIVKKSLQYQKRVIRGGSASFVPEDDEDLITGVSPIPYDLSKYEVLYDVDTCEYVNNGELHLFRIWCFECSRWFEFFDISFHVDCPQCHGSDIADVTNEQFALRGYPVSVIGGLRGHHFAQFDSRGKWNTYMNYIQFPDRPDSIPSEIVFHDVIMDGMTDLVVLSIDNYGFKYRVTSVGPKNTLGTVEFDWETPHG